MKFWYRFLFKHLDPFGVCSSIGDSGGPGHFSYCKHTSQNHSGFFIKLLLVQVNLCQKLLFLQNMGRTCCVQKLFLTFRTISVHNMFSPCSAKIRASDKVLPVHFFRQQSVGSTPLCSKSVVMLVLLLPGSRIKALTDKKDAFELQLYAICLHRIESLSNTCWQLKNAKKIVQLWQKMPLN